MMTTQKINLVNLRYENTEHTQTERVYSNNKMDSGLVVVANSNNNNFNDDNKKKKRNISTYG